MVVRCQNQSPHMWLTRLFSLLEYTSDTELKATCSMLVGGSSLHHVAGRMPGIETNTYQMACLVAHIESLAFKRPPASCSWVCPGGGHQACLMSYVVPSYMCDDRAYISSVCLEPPVVREIKHHRATYQQKEGSSKCQIENKDRSHAPFLSRPTRSQQRVWILMIK